MSGITLLSVNWNQRKVTELMLKSFVKHHYVGEPLELMLVDNGSVDDSKKWLTENEIPFIDSPINLGHEAAINLVYKKIKTKYCLLVDTDLQFMANVYSTYLPLLDYQKVIAGDLISGDNLGYKIVPRIGAWFQMFDIELLKSKGIVKYRDASNCAYDTGSWITEKIFELGYTHHQIDRKPGSIDFDVIGMNYTTHYHLGKMSWEQNHHHDRRDEIAMRMRYVEEQLPLYNDIDLKNKFK